MKKFTYLAIACVAALTACKKDKKPAVVTELDKIKDTVYYYAKEDYLWFDQLPTYENFNPRKFTGSSDLAALQDEIDAISQYPINPSTSKPYEYNVDNPGTSKYSFIDDGSTAGELGGRSGDFGFLPRYDVDNSLYVKYVYPGSPADLAGLKRGYKIIKINERSDMSPTNETFSFLNTAFYGDALKNIPPPTKIDLTVTKPDNSTLTATVNATEYTINPVLKTTVIDAGSGHKVGYIAFNIFTAIENAQPKLEAAFDTFSAANVTDMIVDLRYNGGDRINTQELFANLLVPTAENGKLMMTTYYNQNFQDNKIPLIAKSVFEVDLSDIPTGFFKPANQATLFAKKKTVNPVNIVFLVTGSTASASELLINNLIPHATVRVIGEQTYGKPVGFYAIPIGKYDFYIPEIENRNSDGKADFYQGMIPGSAGFPGKNTYDNVSKDFGDPSENLIANALSFITKGTYVATTSTPQTFRNLSINEMRAEGLRLDKKFKGAVYEKKGL